MEDLTSIHFQNIKKSLRGKRFWPNEETTAAANGYFEDLPEYYIRDGIHKLKHHWKKCIELNRDYTYTFQNQIHASSLVGLKLSDGLVYLLEFFVAWDFYS